MKKLVIPIAVCLLIAGGVIATLQFTAEKKANLEQTANTSETDTKATIVKNPYEDYIDDEGMLVLGDSNAPITIIELSSLSCPHCATFHKQTLPDILKDYVYTGKVKFVFHDFPLNQSAVNGSLLLKCVPINKRYEFTEMLFAQQAMWAYDTQFHTKLKQYAALLGINGEKVDECVNDKEAEKKMFDAMRAKNIAYKVDSTPSFIILPSEKVIRGAKPYGVFSLEIERLLSENK